MNRLGIDLAYLQHAAVCRTASPSKHAACTEALALACAAGLARAWQSQSLTHTGRLSGGCRFGVLKGPPSPRACWSSPRMPRQRIMTACGVCLHPVLAGGATPAAVGFRARTQGPACAAQTVSGPPRSAAWACAAWAAGGAGAAATCVHATPSDQRAHVQGYRSAKRLLMGAKTVEIAHVAKGEF